MLRRRLAALVAGGKTSASALSRVSSSTTAEPVADGLDHSQTTNTEVTPANRGINVAHRSVLTRVLERVAASIAAPTTTTTAATEPESASERPTVLGLTYPPPSTASTVSADADETAGNTKAALDLFAQAFAATWHIVEQRPYARIVSRVANPAAASAPLETCVVATSALSLASARQATVVEQLVEVQNLATAWVELCRREWQRCQGGGRAEGPAAVQLADDMLNATSAATSSTGSERHRRRRALKQYLQRKLGSEEATEQLLTGQTDRTASSAAGTTPKTLQTLEATVHRALSGGACHTNSSLLGCALLQLSLARELLDSPAATAEEAAFLKEVAYAMLVGVTTATYRFDRVSARDGVRPQSCRGLDELLSVLLASLGDSHNTARRFAAEGSAPGGEWPPAGATQTALSRPEQHRPHRPPSHSLLRTFLGLYAGLLPHTVTAVVRADARKDRQNAEGGVASAGSHTLRVVQALRRGWQQTSRNVRVEGASASAVWWLQTAAVAMQAFASCAERQVQLAGEAVADELTGADVSTSLRQEEAALLAKVHAELATVLDGFFRYSRVIYTHYQHATQAATPTTAEGNDDEGLDTLPQRRRRGRRTLFQNDDEVEANSGLTSASRSGDAGGSVTSTGSLVRRPAGVTDAAGDGQRRGAARFVARNRALLQDGLTDAAVVAASTARGAAAVTGKRGRKKGRPSAAAAADDQPSVAETEEAFSALFHVFVLLRTSPSALASLYGISSDRSDDLEETWLCVVHAIRQLERTVWCPSPAQEALLGPQRKRRFQQAAAHVLDSVRVDPRKHTRSPPSSALIAILEPTSAENHLPQSVQQSLDRLRLRVLQHALSSAATDTAAQWDAGLRRAQQTTLRALDAVLRVLPDTVLDGALLIANRISEALLLVVDRSEELATSATQQRAQGGGVSRGWTVMQNHRRSLQAVLAMGAQELVFANDALRDGVCATWWVKRLPQFTCHTELAGAADPRALGFSRRLHSAATALQARHKLLSSDDKLQHIEDSLTCLEGAVAHGGAVAVPTQRLDLPSRQALVSCTLCHLLAVGQHLSAHAKGLPASQITTGTDTSPRADLSAPADFDAADAAARADKAYRRLVALLKADGELVLLSGFAAGLSAWHALSRHFQRADDSEYGDAAIAAAVVPLTLSAVVASVERSRLVDSPSTHASLCEHALLVLAGLSEHTLTLKPRELNSSADTVRGARKSARRSSTAVPWAQWRAALTQLNVYCLGWALRDPGTAGCAAADSAAVSLALYARYTSPRDVPWREELDRRLPPTSPLRAFWDLPSETSSTSLTADRVLLPAGGYIFFLDHSNRLLFGDYRCSPYHSTLQERSLEALRDYQRALQQSLTAFDALDALPPAAPSASLKARLQVQQQRGRLWFTLSGTFQRHAAPLAGFAISEVRQSHALHPLVRLTERHAADQLFLATQLQPTKGTPTTSPSAAGSGAAVALDVHTASLLLLRFIGSLYQSHSWAMLCSTFRVAQLAYRAETILGTREAVPLHVLGSSTVLGLLQEMPNPRAFVRLRPTFLHVLHRFADMLSASGTTLLGMRNGSAVRGWLSRPNRDVYRSVIFGMKQMVLYVQREAVWFCAGAVTTTATTEGVNDDEDGDKAHTGGPSRAPYYSAGYRAGRSPAALANEFALFVAILRSAVELVLECVQHHALQQRVIDRALTDIVTTCHDVLCDLLCDVIHTLLAEEAAHKRGHKAVKSGAVSEPFAEEHATLLLVGLSSLAALCVVQQHDPASVFYHGRARRGVEKVIAAVGTLLDATPHLHVALQTALTRFVASGFYSREFSWRLGTVLYGRADVTVHVVVLSTLANAAIQHPEAAAVYWKAWRQLQTELLQGVGVHGDEGKKGKSARKATSVSKTAATSGAALTSTFTVPSRHEFQLAVSAFNELDERCRLSKRDAQKRQGGVGVFTRAAPDTASPTTTDPVADSVTLWEWRCEPAKLAAIVVEDTALLAHKTSTDDETASAQALDDGGDDDSGEEAGATTVLLPDKTRGPSAHQASYPRVGFVFHAALDVAEALAEGVLTSAEIIGAVTQQSRDLGLVSSALTTHGITSVDGGTAVNGMTPQVRAVMESYLHNMLALCAHYTLADICADSAGAASMFRVLEPWLALRETSALARTHQSTATRLWRLLTDKFHRELLAPHEAAFSAYQEQLLHAVSRLREGEIHSERGTTVHGHLMAPPAPAEDIFFVPGVFASAAREATTGLYAPLDMLELSPHDDVRRCLPPAPTLRTASRATYTQREACRTPVFPTAVPLEVTMVLLRALLRGDRRVPEVRDLADCVATYAARQYALLRTRLDGSALNILPALLAEDETRAAVLGESDAPRPGASAASAKTANHSRVQNRLWITLGLPTRGVHCARARGALFTPDKARALSDAFAEAGFPVDADAAGSVEQTVFDYMRAGALYLQLLSTIASVLLRYKLFGDLIDDSVRALFYATSSRGDDGLDVPLGSEDDGTHHPQWRQFMRQTQPAWVNRNLFESVMLHYLNVSVTLTRHADTLYHTAADRVVDLGARAGPHSTAADGDVVMPYVEEVRRMVADAIQSTLSALGFLAGRTDLSHIRCAAHHLVSGCSCDPLTLPNSLAAFRAARPTLAADAVSRQFAAQQSQLRALAQQYPPVRVGSPTMLAVLTPSYFQRSLTYTMPRAQSAAVTPVAASFTYYMQQPHVALASLLGAVAELLASTPVRNSAQKMLCEKLARALLERPDFRQALAPPTVASGRRGGGGSSEEMDAAGFHTLTAATVAASGGPDGHVSTDALPNEVLIPFLAAMTRGDVRIATSTLAKLLHTAMHMRADVFGEPPVATRQAKLSLVRGGGVRQVGGSFDLANPLYIRPKTSSRPDSKDTEEPTTVHGEATDLLEEPQRGKAVAAASSQSQKDLAQLEEFSITGSSDSASATHRRALASLNLSLSAAMEVAMHLGASRRLTKAESVRARSLLRAADDARRERVGVYRSLLHAATVSGHAKPGEATTAVQPVLDAALHVEDPTDYGVAVLHIQFALRKVVHAAFRRLGPHQSPAALAMMTDTLYAVDPGFRAQREKDSIAAARAGGGGRVDGTEPHRAPKALPAPPLDPMLAGTIRILLSRARLSAQAVGYAANGGPQCYLTVAPGPTTPRGGENPSKADEVNSNSDDSVYQPVLFPLTAAPDSVVTALDSLAPLDNSTPQALRLRQVLEEEAGVAVALTTSVMAASAKMKMRSAVRAAMRQSRAAQAQRRRYEWRRQHNATLKHAPAVGAPVPARASFTASTSRT